MENGEGILHRVKNGMKLEVKSVKSRWSSEASFQRDYGIVFSELGMGILCKLTKPRAAIPSSDCYRRKIRIAA